MEQQFLRNEIIDIKKTLKDADNGTLGLGGAMEIILHNQTILYDIIIKIEKKLCQKDTKCGL